jgi:Rps23 Pro-64 3,4-dihydroxylase Tpa1-like proline 4-hydroxylase
MNDRLFSSLLKHMNIKSVYYYDSNYIDAGRVDDKFLPTWKKFIMNPKVVKLVANNALLGDTLPSVFKYLFINFDLDDSSIFTLKYKEDEIIDANNMLKHLTNEPNLFVELKNIDKIKCISYPFPHMVIDNFIHPDRLSNILTEMKKIQDVDAQSNSVESTPTSQYEFNKYVINTANYGTYLRQLFTELNSQEFIKHIEMITGVQNIICNDPSLYGSGVYRIESKGFSQFHTDFNTYYSKGRKLDRRVHLLLYLNPEWKPEYNGQLGLCDKNTNMCAKKIDPILNRCVIFNTTSSTIHGQPEPLNTPDGVSCQFISVYYCTENTRGDEELDFEGALPRNTIWYPSIDIRARPKQIFYV